MAEYGYQILQALVTDMDPDRRVKEAMNEINASKRLREAATNKAEADKIMQASVWANERPFGVKGSFELCFVCTSCLSYDTRLKRERGGVLYGQQFSSAVNKSSLATAPLRISSSQRFFPGNDFPCSTSVAPYIYYT